MPNNTLPSICVAGNLNLDLMISGVKELPSWGEERFGTERRCVTAGQAGYMGIAAARLGTEVSIIGVVGEDSDGISIQEDLRQADIDCSGIAVASGKMTGLTVAIIREDGERCFVSEPGASSAFNADHILSQWHLIARHRALAVVGIFNTPSLTLRGIHTCFERARRDGITTILDTGWDPAGWQEQTREDVLTLLSSVDLFLPNEDEALAITQAKDVHAALEVLAAACSGTVVVKMGSKGAISRSSNENLMVPARPVENANAVGAGDVYDAALVSALQLGFEFRDAMEFAGEAAAYYVARLDDRYPRYSDVPSKN
jgi:ribokinase